MQEQVLDLRNHTLGEAHPDSLRSMERLALIHRRAGCLDQAKEIQLQVMSSRMQLPPFGNKHPETHRIIEALGDTYRKLGDVSRAEELGALWRRLRFPNDPANNNVGTDPTDVASEDPSNMTSSHLPSSNLRLPWITFLALCFFVLIRSIGLLGLFIGSVSFVLFFHLLV